MNDLTTLAATMGTSILFLFTFIVNVKLNIHVHYTLFILNFKTQNQASFFVALWTCMYRILVRILKYINT